jgi:hypothetical protein
MVVLARRMQTRLLGVRRRCGCVSTPSVPDLRSSTLEAVCDLAPHQIKTSLHVGARGVPPGSKTCHGRHVRARRGPAGIEQFLGYLIPELVYSLDPTPRMSRPSNWCANHGDELLYAVAPARISVHLHIG